MQNKSAEKWILYSTCDEDSFSELRALDLTPSDAVVSVTGSGCRTLSLLTRNPRSVISVDYSPGQNYLLELKLAAIRALSYDDLLAFLGIDKSERRWETFELLAPRISALAAAYFRRYPNAINNGVLFSGRHEQFYVRVVAPLMHLLFGRKLRRLFAARTLDEQRQIYREQVAGRLWRWMIRQGFSESSLRRILNDDKYHIEIDVPSPGNYLLERLDHTFSHHLARRNHWVSFMINGKYPDRTCLPHFLLRESYEAIRRATTILTPVSENLIEYMKRMSDKSVDKFSLSDVTSCINKAEFNALLEQVFRTGKPGARLCYRNFLAKYSLPKDTDRRIVRDDALASELDRDDLAFAYSFEVATLAGTREPAAVAATRGALHQMR
jgi:S-adenosylmethionine-diacylglycerol 3-amino-3-carboxypropyl transferase